MNKVIWTCWFQGWDRAPPLIRRCIASWEHENPDWTVRCLDSESARRLVGLDQLLDTSRASVTAASMADILRIMLLHEFGGVWVDATTVCNRSLSDWLPAATENEGFFGFDKPSRTRPIASWFLAARPGSLILERWFRETVDYWRGRDSSPDYFWFHDLFRELLVSDAEFAAAWDRVPKIGADGPHSLQREDRLYRPLVEVSEAVDWEAPLFKLTHRLQREWTDDSFVGRLVNGDALPFRITSDESKETLKYPGHHSTPRLETLTPARTPSKSPIAGFASLAVDTDNIGDHIQIIAADRLLARLGHEPLFRVDRDSGLANSPPVESEGDQFGLILNGWFKRGAGGWPPSPRYSAIPIGFHVRPQKSSALLSDESLDYLRQSGPVGARDKFTADLLNERGVPAFDSNCLSSLFPRRENRPVSQVETFVVSRDRRVLEALPASLRGATFVNHYTGDMSFAANVHAAQEMLTRYQARARLIVTTLLHCALPAIAMGIPVIVFYPRNSPEAHASDIERFSSLTRFVPVHSLESTDDVDWSPAPVDLSGHKLKILDRFFDLARRWDIESPRAPLQFAPPART